jgi:hypothetical protein
MLSPALASPGRAAAAEPVGTRCATFADRAVRTLLLAGGELTQIPRSLPTGRLRWYVSRRPTGSLLVEVVESPWSTDRAALEGAAAVLREAGFRARVFAGGSLLLICADRRAL